MEKRTAIIFESGEIRVLTPSELTVITALLNGTPIDKACTPHKNAIENLKNMFNKKGDL